MPYGGRGRGGYNVGLGGRGYQGRGRVGTISTHDRLLRCIATCKYGLVQANPAPLDVCSSVCGHSKAGGVMYGPCLHLRCRVATVMAALKAMATEWRASRGPTMLVVPVQGRCKPMLARGPQVGIPQQVRNTSAGCSRLVHGGDVCTSAWSLFRHEYSLT